MEFTFRKYKEEDREQVIKLLKHLWKFSDNDKHKYFDWKYTQNPYTQTPMGFVALDKDKIVAFRGYMIQPMHYKENVFLNASLADTVTDPDYRRKGLFSKITEYSIQELDKDKNYKVSSNSSSGGATLNGYLKLGWIPLAPRNQLFSFSINSLRTKKREIEFPKEIKQKNKETIILSKSPKISEMAVLAEKESEQNTVSIKKDPTYLKWRLSSPNGNFLYIYYYKEKELVAYIILKESENRKYDIIDYESTKKQQLKILLKTIHRKLSPRYILCWTVNPNDKICNNPRYYGFVKLDIILKHIQKFQKPPFLIRLTCLNQNEDQWMLGQIDLRKANSWNINKIIGDEI